jgi:hypothetical protein
MLKKERKAVVYIQISGYCRLKGGKERRRSTYHPSCERLTFVCVADRGAQRKERRCPLLFAGVVFNGGRRRRLTGGLSYSFAAFEIDASWG